MAVRINADTSRQEAETNSSAFNFQAKYKTHGSSIANKIVTSLPILNIAVPTVFILASYLYAVNESKASLYMAVNHNVPFISDIGNNKPQSSLFTFGLSISCYFTLGIILVRFWQVQHFFVKYDGVLNYVSLAAGLLFIFGKILVASFQFSSQKSVHFVGAGMYVIFSTAYATIQSFISCKNKTLYGKYKNILIVLRIVLAAGMWIGTLIFGVFLLPSLVQYNEKDLAVSQSGEWLFAICKVFFMLTFVVDFRPLHPKLLLIIPARDYSSDVVLSNLNIESLHSTPGFKQNGTEPGGTLQAIQE